MRPAEGFLTSDNVFYPTQAEAEKHEAVLSIREWCENKKFKTEQVLFIIEQNSEAILDYIHASQDILHPFTSGSEVNATQDIVSAAIGQESKQATTADSWHEQGSTESEQVDYPTGTAHKSDPSKISLDKAVHGITEVTTEAVQQQQNDRHKSVSNMGRRS